MTATSAVLPTGQFITTGLAVAVIDPQYVTNSNSTVYNVAGQVESTFDTYGLATQNVYDVRGQVIETRRETRDETGATVWLLSRTAYDDAGRTIASTSQFVEGSTDPVTGTLNTYDAAGRHQTSTDAAGEYLFASLTPGDYYVQFELPAGFEVSPQDAAAAAHGAGS